MAKLIVLGGLIYGGYWLYKYMLAHPNIDKGNVIKTVGVIIVGLIALTKKNNTNSPKIMRTYRCRGCGREISTSFNHFLNPSCRKTINFCQLTDIHRFFLFYHVFDSFSY